MVWFKSNLRVWPISWYSRPILALLAQIDEGVIYRDRTLLLLCFAISVSSLHTSASLEQKSPTVTIGLSWKSKHRTFHFSIWHRDNVELCIHSRGEKRHRLIAHRGNYCFVILRLKCLQRRKIFGLKFFKWKILLPRKQWLDARKAIVRH